MRSLLLCFALTATCACAETDLLPVWNVDSGIVNALGGGYNQFSAPASEASVHLSGDIHRGPGGRSLEVVYRKDFSGYCGMWIHLFDEQADPAGRRLLDATAFPFLSFYIRGAKGGEDFRIQVADEKWLKKDDSKEVAPVSKYLGGLITTNWQEVVVPIADFGVDTSRLAGLTFNFHAEGEGAVYIDDVCFKKAADTPVPLSAAPPVSESAGRPLARAMWVWEIESLLSGTEKQTELFSFCKQHGVNELFLQVTYGFSETNPPKVFLKDPEALRAILKTAGELGIRVHAMDGYPEYALRRFHPEVLALVNAIADFNDASPADERFYGIHLDNEPYQLLGFDGPDRENILTQYLELNTKVMALLKERKSDLVYGVDIPFWLDEKDMDGRPRGLVTFNGARKDTAKHIIDIVNNVGIMDYRNFAGGVDGMIYHALGEVAYADQKGKKLYLGAETFRYEPTPVTFVYGLPERDWLALQNGTAGCTLSSRVDGFQVRTFSDGARRYVGLAQPRELKDRAAFDAAIEKLYKLYGAGSDVNPDALAGSAETAIRKNPDYKDFQKFERKDKTGGIQAVGFETTEVMLGKITFAGMTRKQMEDVLAEVGEFYRPNASFAGFAIHYYTTWKAMRE